MKPVQAWRRHWPVLLLAALLLAVTGHTLLWRSGERRLEQSFAAAVAARRALGWTVTHGPPVRGGWPLSVRLSVPDLALDNGVADPAQHVALRSERLVLRLALARPRSLLLQAEGRQWLRFGGGPEVPYTADSIRIRVPVAPATPPGEPVLRVENLRAGLPTGGLTVGWLTLRGSFTPAAPQGEAAMTLALEAQAITLPPPSADAAWPLGPRVTRLVLDGALTGPWPRLGALAERAALWRDGGGALVLRRLGLIWGPLDLIGSATLALDDDVQPMGAASLRSFGYDETLAALAGAGAIPAETAGAARQGLSRTRRIGDDSNRPVAEATLTLQRRELAIGRIRLGRIPALPWPALP
jgi:hypothetical protein